MKRAYVRPTMVGERFVANEYVAACGDSGKVYNFVCNAGDKFRKYNVYYEKDNRRKYIASNHLLDGAQVSSYHPCDATHEANAKDEFIEGYIDDQRTWEDEKIPVIIWTNNGTDVHCTKNLNISEWQTAKS